MLQALFGAADLAGGRAHALGLTFCQLLFCCTNGAPQRRQLLLHLALGLRQQLIPFRLDRFPAIAQLRPDVLRLTAGELLRVPCVDGGRAFPAAS